MNNDGFVDWSGFTNAGSPLLPSAGVETASAAIHHGRHRWGTDMVPDVGHDTWDRWVGRLDGDDERRLVANRGAAGRLERSAVGRIGRLAT